MAQKIVWGSQLISFQMYATAFGKTSFKIIEVDSKNQNLILH